MGKEIALSILVLVVFLALSNNFVPASENRLSQQEAVGFFNGIKADTVHLMADKTYKASAYRLSPSVIVLCSDEPFDINKIPIHSIVRLIVVNGLVEKIVIMQVSS